MYDKNEAFEGGRNQLKLNSLLEVSSLVNYKVQLSNSLKGKMGKFNLWSAVIPLGKNLDYKDDFKVEVTRNRNRVTGIAKQIVKGTYFWDGKFKLTKIRRGKSLEPIFSVRSQDIVQEVGHPEAYGKVNLQSGQCQNFWQCKGIGMNIFIPSMQSIVVQ